MQNTQSTIHIKAEFNLEFRRFEMKESTFAHLAEHLLSTFKIDTSCPVKILFMDDEKDLVLIDSDAGLSYAIKLSPSFLRLSVQVGSQQVEDAQERGTRGRGGRRGRGNGKLGRKEDSTKEDRLQFKINLWTSRVETLQTKLSVPDLPDETVQALTGRKNYLLNKIENARRKQQNLPPTTLAENNVVETSPETPHPEPTETQPATPFTGRGRGGRGRGGRGRGGRGRRGRGGCHGGDDECQMAFRFTPEGQQLWELLQNCKQELKELKTTEPGSNEIQDKWIECQQLKTRFREAKRAAMKI